MALSDVQSALYQDLQTVLVAGGYNYAYKTIYRVEKNIDKIDKLNCPAISMFLIAITPKEFDEATNGFDLLYGISIFASIDEDVDKTGDMEIYLGKMYEDLVKLFVKHDSNLFKRDEVEKLELGELFPFAKGNLGWGFTTLKIIYK